MRKKYIRMAGLTALILMAYFVSAFAAAEPNFDFSVFENNPLYEVEIDDMDDTGTISFAEDSDKVGAFVGNVEDDEGLIIGSMDIRIVEGIPPILRLSLYYMGEDWIFVDDIILKPAETRYTFEIHRESEVLDGGSIMEGGIVAITDVSSGLIEDIISGNVGSVRCRLSGDRDVDGQLLIDVESLKQMYNDYVEAGGLKNDFSVVNELYPCAIK